MKRICLILLAALLCMEITVASAKREVNMADYDTAVDFLADIETGSKVIFDAWLFSTQPYVDEDTFSLSYPLLNWKDIKYSPVCSIYATEEDLHGIHATSGLGGKKSEFHYVHVEGIAEAPSRNECVYIHIMDGKGKMELIEPEANIYCLNEIVDMESTKNQLIPYLDMFEIKEGTVIKTDDSNVRLSRYQVWVSCGDYTIRFQTEEKRFFVDDVVSGSGIVTSFNDDETISFLLNPNLELIN